jgi:hypothetical protein
MKVPKGNRVLAIAIMLMMVLFVFAACSSGGGSDSGSDTADAAQDNATVSVDSLKTLGEAFELETEEDQWSVGEGKVIYAFKYGGTYYRVQASISEEDQQSYIDIDFNDEDYEEQQHKIIDPLEIEAVDDLSEKILSQEELDAVAGKTGKELVDEGWTYQGSYSLDEMVVWMGYDSFEYSVKFEGHIDEQNDDSFDIEAATKDLKAISAELSGMGDTTSIE